MPKRQRRIDVVRIFNDYLGDSHIDDVSISLDETEYVPPAPAMLLSGSYSAESLAFLSCPQGWIGDWHRAPRQQWILVIRGSVGVEVSTGERRILEAGTIAILEDTEGSGHRSWQVGDEPFLFAVIPLSGDSPPVFHNLDNYDK